MLNAIFRVKKMTSKTCTQTVHGFNENNYTQYFIIIFEVPVIMLIIKFCMRINTLKLFHDGSPHHIETSPHSWTGFYIIGTSAMKVNHLHVIYLYNIFSWYSHSVTTPNEFFFPYVSNIVMIATGYTY